MQLQVMFIMKYPHYLQDWFHYLGSGARVRARPVQCF